MLGIGFAVSSLPPALPPIVYALFSGLNSAAVGLIAHSAYTLSGKVITDPLTRLIVLASGAVASCYESQWLYPVIMVAGGSLTLAWDRSVGVRRRVGRQWKDIKGRKGGRRGGENSDARGVEMETRVESAPAAAPVAAPSSPDDKDAFPASSSRDNPLDNVPSLPLASASNETPTIMTTSPSPAQAQDGEDEDGLHQSLYFTLGVKGGLILCVSSSPCLLSSTPRRPLCSLDRSVLLLTGSPDRKVRVLCRLLRRRRCRARYRYPHPCAGLLHQRVDGWCVLSLLTLFGMRSETYGESVYGLRDVHFWRRAGCHPLAEGVHGRSRLVSTRLMPAFVSAS